MTKRLKKTAIIASIVAGALIVGAIVLGVLNGLIGDGAWNVGWNDYRYDEKGYEIGSGSVLSDNVMRIDVDWIDGEVQIVTCEDRYLSLTESADEALPESAELRWRVSEDGTLSVKYRKSSWFFGIGTSNRNKTLILRVPERLLPQIESVSVDVTSSNVTVSGLRASSFSFASKSGNLETAYCDFQQMSIETQSGRLVLGMPTDAAFVLNWESKSGKFASDYAYQNEGTRYTVGDGSIQITAKSRSGDLFLVKQKENQT